MVMWIVNIRNHLNGESSKQMVLEFVSVKEWETIEESIGRKKPEMWTQPWFRVETGVAKVASTHIQPYNKEAP